MRIAAPERRKHTISLTPLIDVVFILLVFFMLATSFANWGAISISTGLASSNANDQPPAAVVHVSANGVLRYQDDRYALQQLVRALKTARSHNRMSGVIIKPAAQTPLKTSVQVIDRLSGAGIQSLALATEGGE